MIIVFEEDINSSVLLQSIWCFLSKSQVGAASYKLLSDEIEINQDMENIIFVCGNKFPDIYDKIMQLRDKGYDHAVTILNLEYLSPADFKMISALDSVTLIHIKSSISEFEHYIHNKNAHKIRMCSINNSSLIDSISLKPQNLSDNGLSVALKEQDKKIIKLYMEGYNTLEISEMTSLSPNTVNAYKSKITKKMNCNSFAKAVLQIQKQNLI